MNKSLPNILTSKLKDNEISIFLFHGVYKKNNFLIRNYTKKHLEENIFEKCISELKNEANPLSMDDVIRIYENKEKINLKNFVFTVDDGFEIYLSIAYPIMRDHKVPMIVYLTTDFINSNELSWIDKIEHCIETTKKKDIILGKKLYQIDSIEKKISFLNLIRKNFKRKKNINFDLLVKEIKSKTNVLNVSNFKNQLDLKISWEQVNRFSKEKYINFGGHSHTHKILSFLSSKELEKEISICSKLLLKKGNLNTPHFSYPEGLKYCFSKKVITMLKKYQYKCSPTAIKGNNNFRNNLFNLKRIMVN